MALTNIEYGSVATSKVLNDNFNYLEDKIEDYSKNIATNNASLTALINSQSSTITNNLNNSIAEMTEQINGINEELSSTSTKLKDSIVITEAKRDGLNWYRIYSDGWCEQGGYYGRGVAYNEVVAGGLSTMKLLKSFKDTNYTVMLTPYQTTAGDASFYVQSKSLDKFTFTWGAYVSGSRCNDLMWEAKGYIE